MRKYLIIGLVFLFLSACSESTEQASQEGEQTLVVDKNKKASILKGYQDQKQKAKDMEKEILKAAERQRKAIDG